ncbi:MAG: helix-turn-helix domain-containing protein [Bacteroidota bacterium]
MNQEDTPKHKKTGNEDIGRRLDKIRMSMDLSKADFASLLGFKHVNSISHIINGTRNLTVQHLIILVSNLKGLNVPWLLTGEGDMLPSAEQRNLEATVERLSIEKEDLEKQVKRLDRERKILFDMAEALTKQYILGEPVDLKRLNSDDPEAGA